MPTVKGVYKTKPETTENSKEGKSGTEVNLTANYFKMIKMPKFEFNLYRINFDPDVQLGALRKRFIYDQKEIFGGYLFDGQSMLYLTRCLDSTTKVFQCESREGEKYKMTVKNTGSKIQMTDGIAMQVLNIILRQTMEGLKMQEVGRNLYDPDNKVTLKEYKVELWPGYITSIRQHENDVLVCCEVSHKVMRQETAYEIIKSCQRDDAGKWKDNFKKEIIGTTILTDYNNKTYRVDDVTFEISPSDTFTKGDKEISYKEYYETRYNLNIKDPKQPMLVSNPKASDVRAGRTKVILLVPELCRATGLTEKMRSNFQMMKAMAEYTQMNPEKRKKRLLDFTNRLHNTKESLDKMAAFNTDLSDQLVACKGRELIQESMLFGAERTAINDNKADWTNPMKMNQMFSSIPLKRWAFIYPKKCSKEAQEFLSILSEVSNGMHYQMSDPKLVELPDDRPATYLTELHAVLQKDPKMVMIVLPNNAADRYSAIKKATCVNRAVPTQLIVQKTMMPKKGNMGGVRSIATKVMIQVNSKLGGAPWMIKFPVKGMMTIGFDVTHDTNDRSCAFGAFVASMDLQETVKFFSAASSHKDGNEMSNNIVVNVIQALRVYKDTHNSLPERIFFYRDGVGDGQIEYVHSQEVKKIEEKLKEMYEKHGKTAEPKLSFIIVNKRINTRFFLNRGSKVDNPVPGTVIDNTVTLPER